jgi:hypothetical protein
MTTSKPPGIDASDSEWLVYADQLQHAHDARGELIVLNHGVRGGQPPAALDAFVKAHAEEVLGPAGRFVDRMKLEWRWLYVDAAEVAARSTEDAHAVHALLSSPAAGMLRSLQVGGDAATENDRIELDAVAAHVGSKGAPDSLRSLALIDLRAARSTSVIATFYDPPPNVVTFGELGALWPKMSKLEHLHLSTSDGLQLDLGAIALPLLRTFRFDCLTWGGRDDLPEALQSAAWPSLESFELRLPEFWTFSIPDDPSGYTRPYADREEDDEYGDDDGYHEPVAWGRHLGPVLASLGKTKLQRLALTSFESARSVVETIRDTGLPETVRELDFSDSSITGDDLAVLFAKTTAVRGVKRLVLNRTPVAADAIEALRGRGLDVVHSSGGGATYRFLVGME